MSDRSVIVADSLGFCAGVERAVGRLKEGADEARGKGLPCYVYGDIVHNKEVMASFSSYGIKRIFSPEEAPGPGIVVIRAHGIPDDMRKRFCSSGFTLIDATCPVVLRNQELVRSSDRPVLIIGYPEHAEVRSLAGAAKTDCQVVSSAAEIATVDRGLTYNAVLQTTFSDTEYDRIVLKAKEIGLHVRFLNSVCSASRMRRLAVMRIRSSADAFVVIGDRMSANTRELAALASEAGCRVFSVEKADDLPQDVFSYDKIGVTAGASTPSAVYNDVIEALRSRNG